jgi:hypothetical protein
MPAAITPTIWMKTQHMAAPEVICYMNFHDRPQERHEKVTAGIPMGGPPRSERQVQPLILKWTG